MLEKLLSRRGFKIYIVSAFTMLAYVFWLRFTNQGIVDWVDWLQASLFSGYYSPEMSMLILIIPIGLAGLAIGLGYDALTGQGIFAGRENTRDLANPEGNRGIDYQAVNRPDFIDAVRARYHDQIYQLKMLGFEELGYYREIVPWFGISIGWKGWLGALGVLANEVTRLGPQGTVNAFYPLMVSRKDASYASVSKLGVEFLTGFAEGTCWRSGNYHGSQFQDPDQKLYKKTVHRTIQAAWADHQQQVNQLLAEGKTVLPEISLANYFSMVKRFNEYMMAHHSQLAKSLRDEPGTLSIFISAIISAGIFTSVILAFVFIANLIAHIFPGCWFVRSLHWDPLLLHFLGIPASLAVSWVLARFQHRLFTVDGVGTQLYGRDPLPEAQKYISTKWLVLPWIPLVPVRSYKITLEGTDPTGRQLFSMQPLEGIYWPQVRATTRRAVIGGGILALLLAAFAFWAVSECK